MKFATRLFLAALIFAGGCVIGMTTMRSGADSLLDPNMPGSANDPLVSKSYVDQQVRQQVRQQVSQQVSQQVTQQVNQQLNQQINQQVKVQLEAELQKRQDLMRSMIVVELKPGETLLAGEGAEFIVRNGKAVIVSPNPNGVPDITDGVDLKADTIVPNNHLLLFPREDGRGIKPHESQKDTVFVMVRGKYMHIGADGKPIPASS